MSHQSNGIRVSDLKIPGVQFAVAHVRIFGKRLVVNRMQVVKHFGCTIYRRQDAKSRQAREKARAAKDFELAQYLTADEKPAIPAASVKNALIGAGRYCHLAMSRIRTAIYVCPQDMSTCGTELLLLHFKKCRMREDMVRVQHTPFVRRRPEYLDWSINFAVQYRLGSVSHEQMLELIILAGKCIGLGDGRHENSALGWGRFALDPKVAIQAEHAA